MTSAGEGSGGPLTAPIPVVRERPTLRQTLAVFSLHNYRLYFTGLLANSTGGWMARVAIDWLLIELTGNVALVGLALALQFTPTLLLGPWAGLVSDRVPRLALIRITTGVTAVSVGALGAVTISGLVEVWHVFAVSLALGLAMAFDGPSRLAFISEIVGTSRLQQAISLNAGTFHFGALLGPALSGVLIAAFGSGWSIAINGATSTLAFVMLLLIRRAELIPSPRQPSGRGQIREALRYAVRKPTIIWPLVLVALAASFGMGMPVLIAGAASDAGWGTGAPGYGLYNSLVAVGSLTGAFVSTRRRSLRLRSLVLLIVAFGAAIVAAGVVPVHWAFLVVLVAVGTARLAFIVGAESLVMLSANPGIRGRIGSFHLLVLIGGQAVAGAVIGWVAQTFGLITGFLVAGGVTVLAGLAVALILAHRHQLRLKVDLRSPRRLVRIVRRGQVVTEG